MRHELGKVPLEILMEPVADFEFNETNWWRFERGMIVDLEEYIKFAHNWWQG